MGLKDKPKQALISYRISTTYEVYKEDTDVASLPHWNLTVNRLYYSIFHISSALLLSAGYNIKSHDGLIRIIMKDYVRTRLLTVEEGQLISSLYNMRQTGDYDDLYDWKQEDIEPLILPTKELLEKLKTFIKTDNCTL